MSTSARGVDIFFRSLADTHGGRSIAIVLSGVDGNGAIGIKRIKEKGGMTVAQEPGEAQYKGMQRSAIDTRMVDWVLQISEMPRRLLEYRRTLERVRLPKERRSVLSRPDDSDDEKALRSIISLLRVRTSHAFSFYNRRTIVLRIGRRMRVSYFVPQLVDLFRPRGAKARVRYLSLNKYRLYADS